MPKVGHEIGRVGWLGYCRASSKVQFEAIGEMAVVEVRIAIRQFVHLFLNRGRSKGGRV